MKKIFTLIAFSVILATVFSCETYKVADPEMTAIHKVDGKYMAFAMDPKNAADTLTMFAIVITNTTDNAKDAGWITIVDMDYSYCHWQRLFAVRFKIGINAEAQTFNASDAEVTEPQTAWNPYIEGAYGSYGSYYTASRQWPANFNYTTTATIANGKVVTDGVTTPSGYKADSIEFDYTINYNDGTSDTYHLKGQKKTGWADDAKEYEDWLVRVGLW